MGLERHQNRTSNATHFERNLSARVVLANVPNYIINKLEVAQKAIIRTILGAIKFTPVDQLHLETGIETIAFRIKRLSLSYLTKISFNPYNQVYNLISYINSCSIFIWRKRSNPCVLPALN